MDGFMQHLLLEYHVLVLMVVLLGVNLIELVLGMMVTCQDYFKKNYKHVSGEYDLFIKYSEGYKC
jgi:hypothetical protein